MAQLAVVVIAAVAPQAAELPERTRVEEDVDPLAHRQLAEAPLAGDAHFPTHGAGERRSPLQFLQLTRPGHATDLSSCSFEAALVGETERRRRSRPTIGLYGSRSGAARWWPWRGVQTLSRPARWPSRTSGPGGRAPRP